jgi:hypothetical protein
MKTLETMLYYFWGSAVAFFAGVIFCVACGGGNTQVSAESARVAACQGVEQSIEDSDANLHEKIERIDCVRTVCDALHSRIVESADE